MGNEGCGGPLKPAGAGVGSTRFPSRIFSSKCQPRCSARRADGDDDESVAEIELERPSAVDVLCAAHCGEQQVPYLTRIAFDAFYERGPKINGFLEKKAWFPRWYGGEDRRRASWHKRT